jgi:hypothetical protein
LSICRSLSFFFGKLHNIETARKALTGIEDDDDADEDEDADKDSEDNVRCRWSDWKMTKMQIKTTMQTKTMLDAEWSDPKTRHHKD